MQEHSYCTEIGVPEDFPGVAVETLVQGFVDCCMLCTRSLHVYPVTREWLRGPVFLG